MRLLQCLILGLPWLFVPWVNNPFLLPKEAGFLLGTLAFVLCTLLSTRTRLANWDNPPLQWFALWVLVWSGWRFWGLLIKAPPNPDSVIFNVSTWIVALNIIIGILFISTLVTHWLPRWDVCVRVTQWSCWAAFLIACFMLMQYVRIDPWFVGMGRIHSFPQDAPMSSRYMLATLGNVNYAATYLAMHLPLYLIFREKRYLLFGIVVLAALLLTEVRFAIVSGLLGLVAYGWIRLYQRHRRWWTLLLGLLLCIGMIGIGYTKRSLLTHDERWGVWRQTLIDWKKQPFRGYGLNSFAIRYHLKWNETRQEIPSQWRPARASGWKWTHNDPLQTLFELGLLGMVPLLMALWIAFRRAMWKVLHGPPQEFHAGWLGAGVSMLAVSCTNFPWHLAPCALMGCVILAMWQAREPRGVS